MRICFFGDSFTNGTGDDDCLGWVGRVCSTWRHQGHDLTAYNLGVRRDTSGDIASRWEAEAKARLPVTHAARLVFAFGHNDAAQGETGDGPRLTLSQTLHNASSILSVAQKMAPTFMIGPVPAFIDTVQMKAIAAMSEALSALCAPMNVPFLSLTALPDLFWDDWKIEAKAGDGVHPNSKGYENLAKVITDWVPFAL